MSWNEFVVELSNRQHDLDALYSDIDIPEDDKTTQYSELFNNVLKLMDEHVGELRDLKEQLESEVESFQTDIQNLTLWLGQEDDTAETLSKRLEGLTLWSKHRLLRDEYNSRFELYRGKLDTVRDLHRQLQDFAIQLGSNFVDPGPYPEEGHHVTFEVIRTFTDNVEECNKEKERRIDQINRLIVAIQHLWSELGWVPQDPFDLNVIKKGEGYTLSDETITRLELKQSMLEKERKDREAHVQELRNEIRALWEKLRIDDEEQEQFFEKHLGLTMDIVTAHKKELERLLDLKRLKLEEFVAEERTKIHDLWDRLYYSTEQREAFLPIFARELTDEILEQHEAEVARLNEEANEVQPILAAVDKYQTLLEEMRLFEASTRDSSRLLKPEPGLLLKEEKTRNRLNREQPKAEAELQQLLVQYQEEKGRPFLVFGEEYIVTMKTHTAEAREGRENERLRLVTSPQMALFSRRRAHSFTRSISPLPDNAGGGPQTPTHNRTFNAIAPSSPYPTTPSRTRVVPSFMAATPTRSRAHTLSTPTAAAPQSPSSKVTQMLLQTPSGQMHKNLGSNKAYYSRSESPAVHKMAMMQPSSSSAMRSQSEALGTGGVGQQQHPWTPGQSHSIISAESINLNDTDQPLPSTPTRTRTPRPVSFDLTATDRGNGGDDINAGKGGGTTAAETRARLHSVAMDSGRRAAKRTAAEMSPIVGRRHSPTSPAPHRRPQHQHHQDGDNPFFTAESAQCKMGSMVSGDDYATQEDDDDDILMDDVQITNGSRTGAATGSSSTKYHNNNKRRLRVGRSKSQPIEVDEDEGWETEEEDANEDDHHNEDTTMVDPNGDTAKRRRHVPPTVVTTLKKGGGRDDNKVGPSSSSSASTDSRIETMIIHD